MILKIVALLDTYYFEGTSVFSFKPSQAELTERYADHVIEMKDSCREPKVYQVTALDKTKKEILTNCGAYLIGEGGKTLDKLN